MVNFQHLHYVLSLEQNNKEDEDALCDMLKLLHVKQL